MEFGLYLMFVWCYFVFSSIAASFQMHFEHCGKLSHATRFVMLFVAIWDSVAEIIVCHSPRNASLLCGISYANIISFTAQRSMLKALSECNIGDVVVINFVAWCLVLRALAKCNIGNANVINFAARRSVLRALSKSGIGDVDIISFMAQH